MNLDELLILTLSYSDKGMIAGRTLLQKTIYFLNDKLNLGIEFTPYYYGPYSAEVADTVASLKASGIIKEIVEIFPSFNFGVSFEPRRYVYQLTDTGKQMADLIEKRQSQEVKEVKDILEQMKKLGTTDDYKSLSIAAKMCHILKIEAKPMTSEEILDQAKALDWQIEQKEAEAAVAFLQNMDLVKVKKVKKLTTKKA